jgi:hypothetical protein
MTLSIGSFAQANRFEELANLPLATDCPTEQTAQRLEDELLFERGVQSYLWALPAINMWAVKGGLHRYHSRIAFCGIWPKCRPPSAAKAVITKHLLRRVYWFTGSP